MDAFENDRAKTTWVPNRTIVKTYVRNPEPIEAVLVTESNIQEVALWCGGRVVKDEPQTDPYTHVIVPHIAGPLKVQVGFYLVKGQDGRFYPLKKDELEKKYTETSAPTTVLVNR